MLTNITNSLFQMEHKYTNTFITIHCFKNIAIALFKNRSYYTYLYTLITM